MAAAGLAVVGPGGWGGTRVLPERKRLRGGRGATPCQWMMRLRLRRRWPASASATRCTLICRQVPSREKNEASRSLYQTLRASGIQARIFDTGESIWCRQDQPSPVHQLPPLHQLPNNPQSFRDNRRRRLMRLRGRVYIGGPRLTRMERGRARWSRKPLSQRRTHSLRRTLRTPRTPLPRTPRVAGIASTSRYRRDARTEPPSRRPRPIHERSEKIVPNYTLSGTTNGARYVRLNIALASSSPLQV